MRKIALEEAIMVPGQADVLHADANPAAGRNYAELVDIDGVRLQEMDASDTEIAVLSLTTPGLQGVHDASAAPRLAREWNDYLAQAISAHPDRFEGFAALPMREPEAAARELQRCVRELGFVGALINGYDDSGRGEPLYYDTPEYLDFWHGVAELDVPVYLHPRMAPADRVTTYSPYPELAAAAWGFHVETGEHMLRLMLSGLFDEVPGLRFIVGHMGEMIVWWAWRTDRRIEALSRSDLQIEAKRQCQNSVSHYLRTNFYVTTSGWFETSALLHTLGVMGTERVLYSVDYPYESFREASDWLESLALDERVKREIAYDNAAGLLGIGSSSVTTTGEPRSAPPAQLPH
jgi:predicted TIM-barrel fold metal-dependent hydrolase